VVVSGVPGVEWSHARSKQHQKHLFILVTRFHVSSSSLCDLT
jgi:hypothetical protein